MAKFRFRLEAVLSLRERIEKEKQRRVAAIGQEIQGVVRTIHETRLRITEENHRLGKKELTGTLDMQYIANEKRFVGNLHLRIALAMDKLRKLEEQQAAARAQLMEAARERKVIEKLREKQFDAWRIEQDRKDAALTDEIGVQLSARQPIDA